MMRRNRSILGADGPTFGAVVIVPPSHNIYNVYIYNVVINNKKENTRMNAHNEEEEERETERKESRNNLI